jgi:hypothetical protein
MLPPKKRAKIIATLNTDPNTSLFAKLSGTLSSTGIPYVLLILAVLSAYANVYNNAFLFDDPHLITDNKFLTSWHHAGTLFVTNITQGASLQSPFYRPLQTLLYLFVYQIAGPSIIAFHLLNITLHAANACLLYALGVRLGFQRIATLLAALLWALHPVQTEAVTYMSATADPLCAAFLLAGILVLVPEFSRPCVLTACVLFALGLLSKETAVVFPMLAVTLLFYRSEDRWSPKIYLKTWPFWLMTAFYFLTRETLLNSNGFLGTYSSGVTAQATIWDHFYTFLATLPVYARLIVWPTGLHMERIFPTYLMQRDVSIYRIFLIPQIAAGFALLAAVLTGIAWRPARRATPLAWGLLWASVVHFPQSGILVPSDALISENWLYLPTAGMALGLGESLAGLCEHVHTQWLPSVLATLAILIACLFGVMTFEQNKVWRDPVVFYTHILECGEPSARARNNLGAFYEEKGEYAKAIEQYRGALAFSDTNADAHYNLGASMILLDHSRPSVTEAVGHFQRALEIDPDYYLADEGMAYVYAHLGDHVKEAECLARAAAIKKKLGID